MIKDNIKNLYRWADEVPGIEEICTFIKNYDMLNLETGQYPILNKDIFVNIEKYWTVKADEKKYEAHKKYIDIQYVLSGKETIYIDNEALLKSEMAYDEARDIIFYQDGVNPVKFDISENEFLVIYPGEAHKPCIECGGQELVLKAVFKIRV